MEKRLRQVIRVDEDKCVNCHACISACPVKYCIDGSGDKVRLIHELCIGCGSCIRACSHGARSGIDDCDAFLADLEHGRRIIAFVAPAVAARFPDNYLRLNGWLASLGVEAFFDVSFGAELTVESYLRHIKTAAPPLVIAQPCPAIVSYLEIYQPELLPYLAPADSPMLHAMKMVRAFYPEWKDRKIAVISPCVAKRREFDATGLGDYNVTLESLVRLMTAGSVRLSSFPELQFQTPPAERAVLFSSPGGLKETVDRELPGMGSRVRKIEGPSLVYPYFRDLPLALAKSANPLVVDCLNCEKGCNGGTGTGSQETPIDILEDAVRRRDARQRRLLTGKGPFRSASVGRIRASVRRFWKPGLYLRRYEDRSASLALSSPSEAEFADIYARMRKVQPSDFLDCSACGYDSCKGMAIAIHNGLNKPENCKHYDQLVREESKRTVVDMSIALDEELGRSTALLEQVMGMLPELNQLTGNQSRSLADSTDKIGSLLARLKDSSARSAKRQIELSGLLATAGSVQTELSGSLQMVIRLKDHMRGVHELVDDINKVASQTDLLSMNAAIEAAHAGATGRGFAVVASEIRTLSDQASKSAAQVGQTLALMAKDIEKTAAATESSGVNIRRLFGDLEQEAAGMKEIFDSLAAMAAETDIIGGSLETLTETAGSALNTYHRMEQSLRGTAGEITTIAGISRDNRSKIEGL